jgi:dihydrofolate reductase
MNDRTWRGRVFIGTSLDGYIARSDGSLEWLTQPADLPHAVPSAPTHRALIWENFYPTIDTVLMGRATYDSVLGFQEWPFGEKRVIVLTGRHDLADSRINTVSSLDDAVRRLDEVGAREVYIDGGRTIQAFLREGLIDELTVSVAPIVLGGGRRLFADLEKDLRLVILGSHATDDGLVRTTYGVVTAE